MKKLLSLVLAAFMLLSLSACEGSKIKSAKEIKNEIGDNYLPVFVDGELINLKTDSVEIEKRQTDETKDTIFCTIKRSNNEYTMTAKCIVIYTNYNTQGGWVLSSCRIIDEQYTLSYINTARKINEKIIRNKSDYSSISLKDSSENEIEGVFQTSFSVKGSYKFCDVNMDLNLGSWLESYIKDDGIHANWNYCGSVINSYSNWKIEGRFYNNSNFTCSIRSFDHNTLYADISASDYFMIGGWQTSSQWCRIYEDVDDRLMPYLIVETGIHDFAISVDEAFYEGGFGGYIYLMYSAE